MRCKECGSPSTYVRDTATSSADIDTDAKGHKYLAVYGKGKVWDLGLPQDTPFTVRLLECADCGTRYRTLEYPVDTYAPKGTRDTYGRAGKRGG